MSKIKLDKEISSALNSLGTKAGSVIGITPGIEGNFTNNTMPCFKDYVGCITTLCQLSAQYKTLLASDVTECKRRIGIIEKTDNDLAAGFIAK